MIKAADDFANINARLKQLEGRPVEKPITVYGGAAGGAMGGGSGNASQGDINNGTFSDDLSAWEDC